MDTYNNMETQNSNPIFSKFDSVLGKTNSTSTSSVPSRADQVLSMEKENQQADSGDIPDKTSHLTPNQSAAARGTVGDYFKGVASQFDNARKSIGSDIDDANAGKNPIDAIGHLFRGGTNIAGDMAGAVFSPITQGLGMAIHSIANHVGDSETLQKLTGGTSGGNGVPTLGDTLDFLQNGGDKVKQWSESHPEIAHALGSIMNIGALVTSPELETSLSDLAKKNATSAADSIADTTGKIVDKTKEIAQPIVDKAKEMVTKNTDGQFQTNLDDAEKSIYGKMTPTEKGSIKLKDEKGIFGTKSTADFQADPRTKSIIESVANLPEDIKLKPSDSVAIREEKLNQGISRMHQETEGLVSDPTTKTDTTFKSEHYDAYMKEKVLDPVEKEFGTDSAEYKAAEKAVETSKKSLTSNDIEGVYKGRQKFNTSFEQENPRAFKKAKGSFGAQLDPQTTATVEAGRDVYHAMNDLSEELLPENHPLRPRMKEESNLIRAKEEMRTRSTGELDKSSTRRFLDRNPVAKKAVDTAAGILRVGAGVDLVK